MQRTEEPPKAPDAQWPPEERARRILERKERERREWERQEKLDQEKADQEAANKWEEDRRKDEILRRREEDVKQKEEAVRQKEHQLKWKEMEVRLKEEQITRNSEELKRREAEVIQKDEEVNRKEEEVVHRADEAKRIDVGAREEARRVREENWRKGQEIEYREEELKVTEKELTQKQESLALREAEVKRMEVEARDEARMTREKNWLEKQDMLYRERELRMREKEFRRHERKFIVQNGSREEGERSSTYDAKLLGTYGDQFTKKQIVSCLGRHERQRLAMISKPPKEISWESIPWPMFAPPNGPQDITFSTVATYMLSSNLPDKIKAEPLTDRLKEQFKKWNPDRFEARFHSQIVVRDREKVKEGTQIVMRILNGILLRESPPIVPVDYSLSVPSHSNENNHPTDGGEGSLGLQSSGKAEHAPDLEEWLADLQHELQMQRNEVAQKEEAMRQQELEIKRLEAKRVEEEVMQKEKEARKMEEGAIRLEEEAKRLEDEVRQWEAVAKERETKTMAKADELQRKEADLWLREQAMQQEENKLKRLLADARETTILLKLRSALVTTKHHKRLLECVGTDAQTVLDMFQSLLDTDRFPDRGLLVVAMRRLSEKANIYPKRYLLDGPVQLIKDSPLNGGRFADIYQATFRGELTCLKVLRAHESKLVQHMAKIYAREAILWGQLSHPNLLPFYGLHSFRHQIAFVAPWAVGGDLKEYLAQNPHANCVLLCADIAAGVEYLHAKEVIHGDLKAVCLNVLVDASGRACLGDFGLSGITDKDIIQWTTQSAGASKGGTTRWQAPELHDPEAISTHNTKKTDIFAWASTIYEIFTGNSPFSDVRRETTVALMILRGDLPARPPDDDPAWTVRGLTTGIWELLEDCWRTKPTKRPSMSKVVSRLEPEKPKEDPRPPGQWGAGFAMRFRNAQEAPGGTREPSLEELDRVLEMIVKDDSVDQEINDVIDEAVDAEE
ncbi:hypothetical protein H0H87_000365 [Tephrocybe sp. NHM501043]|nr:hypothetical protein H0H87_000365 [Tephrocybe sp. NHM501043]